MQTAKRHILITGLPGVGKTTLIREIAFRLADLRPAGFYTEEIRDHGTRRGFRLICLDGRQQVLSHVDQHSQFRVSRYGVDVEGFERLLAELDLSHCESPVIIIDEIGKMECCSDRFQETVRALLDSPRTIVATVALKGDGFIKAVKARSDCLLVMVTVHNRSVLADSLARTVHDALQARR